MASTLKSPATEKGAENHADRCKGKADNTCLLQFNSTAKKGYTPDSIQLNTTATYTQHDFITTQT